MAEEKKKQKKKKEKENKKVEESSKEKKEKKIEIKEQSTITSDKGIVSFKDSLKGRIEKIEKKTATTLRKIGEEVVKEVRKAEKKKPKKISLKTRQIVFSFPKRERVTEEWIRERIGIPKEQKTEQTSEPLIETKPIAFEINKPSWIKEYPKDEYGRPMLLYDLKRYDEIENENEEAEEISATELPFYEEGAITQQEEDITNPALLTAPASADVSTTSPFSDLSPSIPASAFIPEHQDISIPVMKDFPLLEQGSKSEDAILDRILEHYRKKEEFKQKKEAVKQLLGIPTGVIAFRGIKPGELVKGIKSNINLNIAKNKNPFKDLFKKKTKKRRKKR